MSTPEVDAISRAALVGLDYALTRPGVSALDRLTLCLHRAQVQNILHTPAATR